jgi:hypothetical protein
VPAPRADALAEDTASLRLVVRSVVASVLGLGPSHPDVEDCAHEALSRALEGRDRLRPGEPLRPWVVGIARHVAIDALRDKKRAQKRTVAERADDDADVALLDRVADPTPGPEERARRAAGCAPASAGALPRGRAEIPGDRGAPRRADGDGRDVDRAGAQVDRRGSRRGWRGEIMSIETLARDVAWEASGHLSEVALSVAADGEDALLDAAMHEHLRSCDACGAELGRVALRSAVAAEAFAAAGARASDPKLAAVFAPPAPVVEIAPAPVSPRPRSVVPRERRKVPVFAIAAAIVVAVLGAAPSLVTAPAWVAEASFVVRKVAPSFFRLLPQVLARAWTGAIGPMVVVSWALAVVLVAVGVGIAKQASKASKKAALDGGRR